MVDTAVAGPPGVAVEDLLDQQLESLMEAGYRLAAVILRDRTEAEDATQDAAALAWRKVSQLRQPSSLRTWFLGIVAQQCRSRLRDRWRAVLKEWTVDRQESFSEETVIQRLDVAAA